MAARCASILRTRSAHAAVSRAVTALLARERDARLREHGDLRRLRRAGASAPSASCSSFLIEAKNEGKTICGYGAPGKGNTLLNYCGIGTDFLDFTVDRNPYKHGRFTPGMHIPIQPVEAIDEAQARTTCSSCPGTCKDEIVAQMRHVADWGGKFVVPIPKSTVIDPRSCGNEGRPVLRRSRARASANIPRTSRSR